MKVSVFAEFKFNPTYRVPELVDDWKKVDTLSSSTLFATFVPDAPEVTVVLFGTASVYVVPTAVEGLKLKVLPTQVLAAAAIALMVGPVE